MNLAKSFFEFNFARVLHASSKGGEDFRAGAELGADDKGEVELGEVAGVEIGELLVFLVAEAVEAEAGLFGGGLGSEFAGAGEFASEVGVSANEGEFFFVGGGLDDGLHKDDEVVASGEGLLREGGFGDPRRVFVNGAQQVDELGLGHLVEI